jgi:D-amino-acid dehydrogenase
VHLPVYPLKGYSITVDVAPEADAAPTVSVTDSARKVVFARIGSRLRVAGMAELSGYDSAVDPAQIASLKASAQTVFPASSAFDSLSPWAGMRPATPTGLPVIGTHAKGPGQPAVQHRPWRAGIHLAFGSAQRISRMMAR